MIVLEKGKKISLEKADHSTLERFYVGAAWDAVVNGKPKNIDLDVHIYVKSNGVTKEHLYYANSSTSGVTYSGDNVTGVGDGIDESMFVDLSKIDSSVDTVELGINMFSSGYSFSNVQNAKAYVYEDPSNFANGLCRFDLSSYNSNILSVMVGRLVRNAANPSKWDFEALGEGFTSKLGSKSPLDSGSSSGSVSASGSASGGGGFFGRLFGR